MSNTEFFQYYTTPHENVSNNTKPSIMEVHSERVAEINQRGKDTQFQIKTK